MSGLRLSWSYAPAPNLPAPPQAPPAPSNADASSTLDAFTVAPRSESKQPWNPLAPRPHRPPVVALTGGPCGGKTSLLQHVRELSHAQVTEVPEIATTTAAWGISLARTAKVEPGRLEGDFLDMQCAQENLACSSALRDLKPLVVCDRGALDAAAFCEPSLWQHLLADRDVTEEQLCERYDFVLHVTSVAVDKPELYTRSNNAARWENAEQAAAQDRALVQAWSRHPNRKTLGNGFADFDAKVAEGRRLIADFVRQYYGDADMRLSA